MSHKITKIHQVKLIALDGSPVRIADVQSAIPKTAWAARLLFALCTAKDYVLHWTALEPFYHTAGHCRGIAGAINKAFRSQRLKIRIVIDG